METYQKIMTLCLIILTAIALATVLATAKMVMIPFTLALFIYLTLTPLMLWLEKKYHFPNWVTILITALALLVLSALIVFFITTSINSFLEGADVYKSKLNNAAIYLAEQVKLIPFLNISFSPEEIREKLQSIPVFPLIKELTSTMIMLLGNSILVMIFSLFLITGDSTTSHGVETLNEIKMSISRYIGIKISMSLLTGVLILILFFAFGVDLALMFGILTICLNFIPSVGSIIAVILPIPVILLEFGIGWEFFTVMGLSAAIQLSIGNLLEPKFMGESVGLHPVTILLSLTFWGFIWGIPGMFLSVPMTATARIMLHKFELTRPMANLMAGKLT